METETVEKTIDEVLKEKIIRYGGLEEDIMYLDEQRINSLAKLLVHEGIKARKQNPRFVVETVTTLRGISHYFDYVDSDINEFRNVLLPVRGKYTVELIGDLSGTTEEILSEIDRRGYVPAPTCCLLGLCIRNPAVIKMYEFLVTLYINDLFMDEHKKEYFLGIGWHGNGKSHLRKVFKSRLWNEDVWFAVIKK